MRPNGTGMAGVPPLEILNCKSPPLSAIIRSEKRINRPSRRKKMDPVHFTGKEILDMAVRIEENGLKFYT
ncbi:MAG: hypothetical protein Q8P48_02850, partial [Deltaproteobacteria bacterium]|nr:hypothetical protein [Deltaproteobacteria bacterium]